MIQSVLLFLLGFLAAALLALMIAPALWRRATLFARKQVEASMPLSLNEVEASRDRIRAESAMAVRRLEIQLKQQRETATLAAADAGRLQQAVAGLESDDAAKAARIGELEQLSEGLRADLAERTGQLDGLSDRFDETSVALTETRATLAGLQAAHDEVSVAASNAQVELAARDAKIDKLMGDIDKLRTARREAEKGTRDVAAQNRSAQEALEAERARHTATEARLERLLADRGDLEDRLERRSGELSRLRGEFKQIRKEVAATGRQLASAEKARAGLDAEVAAMAAQIAMLTEDGASLHTRQALKTLRADRARLERRVRELEAQLAEEHQEGGEPGAASLRAQIADLAAQVVALTAHEEGPQSPVHAALARAPDSHGIQPQVDNIVSLAERIRALQDSKERAE